MNRLPLLFYHIPRRRSIFFRAGSTGGRRNFALISTNPFLDLSPTPPILGTLPNERKIAPVTISPNYGRVATALVFEVSTIILGVLNFEDTNQRKYAFVINTPKVEDIALSATLRPLPLNPKMG
jgi:hypothetical protein